MNYGNYWKQFTKSGSVTDYLAYAAKVEENQKTPAEFHIPGEMEEQSRRRENAVWERSAGEYPYAGFDYGDGNGYQPDSHR